MTFISKYFYLVKMKIILPIIYIGFFLRNVFSLPVAGLGHLKNQNTFVGNSQSGGSELRSSDTHSANEKPLLNKVSSILGHCPQIGRENIAQKQSVNTYSNKLDQWENKLRAGEEVDTYRVGKLKYEIIPTLIIEGIKSDLKIDDNIRFAFLRRRNPRVNALVEVDALGNIIASNPANPKLYHKIGINLYSSEFGKGGFPIFTLFQKAIEGLRRNMGNTLFNELVEQPLKNYYKKSAQKAIKEKINDDDDKIVLFINNKILLDQLVLYFGSPKKRNIVNHLETLRNIHNLEESEKSKYFKTFKLWLK